MAKKMKGKMASKKRSKKMSKGMMKMKGLSSMDKNDLNMMGQNKPQ